MISILPKDPIRLTLKVMREQQQQQQQQQQQDEIISKLSCNISNLLLKLGFKGDSEATTPCQLCLVKRGPSFFAPQKYYKFLPNHITIQTMSVSVHICVFQFPTGSIVGPRYKIKMPTNPSRSQAPVLFVC